MSERSSHLHDHDGAHEGAGHGHAPHGHDHGHGPADFGTAFAVGIALNLAFVGIEATYGALAGSMALLADAGHNLSDVLGLAAAWLGATLGRREPSPRFTYGLRNSSILAALFNALLLLVAVGAIAWEAIRRLWAPEPVAGMTMIVVAGIGIVINAATAALFASGRKGDLNVRGAWLHMMADAGVSAGVVVTGLVILSTGWQWLDPAVSLAIAAFIVWGTWGLLRDSTTMSLAGVPPGIDSEQVRAAIEALPGVESVHDLHVWPMSTTETALTAHLVMPGGCPGDAFIRSAEQAMTEGFGIGHSTFQVERNREACVLAERTGV